MVSRRLIMIGIFLFAEMLCHISACFAYHLDFYAHITDVYEQNIADVFGENQDPFDVKVDEYFSSYAEYDENDIWEWNGLEYLYSDENPDQAATLQINVGGNFTFDGDYDFRGYWYLLFENGVFSGVNFISELVTIGETDLFFESFTDDFYGGSSYFIIWDSNGTYNPNVVASFDDDIALLQGDYVISISAIPEPTTFLLLGAGLIATAGLRRRR